MPEEAAIIPAGSISWHVRHISKSGEEYCIDLLSIPPSTTMFEVVQRLLYMCKRGERGGEISSCTTANHHHKSIVVGPEEWERTYYIEFDLKVLNGQKQKQKQNQKQPQELVKEQRKPKPPKLRGRIYSAKNTKNDGNAEDDGKDWVAPDIYCSSLTSLNCTLHRVEHSLCSNKGKGGCAFALSSEKWGICCSQYCCILHDFYNPDNFFADFWASAGNFATVLHLLAVLQVLLDEGQRQCSSSLSTAAAASIYPMLGQSRSLSTKLQRQCGDPLSMCTDTLPEWCRILPSSLPSLLTLESRMLLFFRTAFGPSRSLDLIQDLSCLIEEEVGGRANSNSAAYEEESPLSPSLVSLEFDCSSDSTMLTKHNLTLFQHLRHLGRLRRLRVSLFLAFLLDR